MRGFYLAVLLVCLLGVSEILGASKEKEHLKKKTLLKLRSELNETAVHSADSVSVNGTEAEGEKDKDKEGASAVVTSGESADNNADKEVVPTVEEAATVEDTSVSKPKPPPSFMSRVKTYVAKFLEFFGFAKQKRKGRLMNNDEDEEVNSLSDLEFSDTVKANVNVAVTKLGKCVNRAICGAGRYLKDFKAKEIIIVLLEKASPSSWKDKVEQIKKAAIHKDECHRYACLE